MAKDSVLLLFPEYLGSLCHIMSLGQVLTYSNICSCMLSFFQDAHEFLSQCLDQLKDDVEKMNKSWTNDAASSSSVVCESGQEATTVSSAVKMEPGEEADTSRIYTCPVAVNMEFEVEHTICCKG